MRILFASFLLTSAFLCAQTPADAPPAALPASTPLPPTPDLRNLHRIFIDKMPNDLDQYIRAEFTKQLRGRVTVVLNQADGDAILTGVSEEEKGTGAKITGRYLGLHDVATGTVSLLDKEGKLLLWSEEAGDRSLVFGALKRGGERKVAERLVGKLKKAMGY
jgi:hypothetical protein